MNHTPAPWEVNLSPHDGNFDCCLQLAASGKSIAVLNLAYIGGFTADQQRANARLIAAAPDLLRTAKEALDHVGIVIIGKGIEAEAAREALRAAILSATEGTPC